jgi:hypothetical protein
MEEEKEMTCGPGMFRMIDIRLILETGFSEGN